MLAGTYAHGQIWRSIDYGATWTPVYVAVDTLAEIPKITFDRTNSNIVWATVWKPVVDGDNHIVKSTDRGLTWQHYVVPGNPWAIETDRLGRVFVGMFDIGERGAFMSDNGGRTWGRLSLGLPTAGQMAYVLMLKSDGGLPGLYMADSHIGAHKLENLPTAVSSAPQLLPHHFHLSQNYPNPYGRLPFNQITKIRYSLSTPQFVTLKIFDTLGREVATLVHKSQTAGDHEISFDASRFPSSGIFIYQLQAGDWIQTKKMILNK